MRVARTSTKRLTARWFATPNIAVCKRATDIDPSLNLNGHNDFLAQGLVTDFGIILGFVGRTPATQTRGRGRTGSMQAARGDGACYFIANWDRRKANRPSASVYRPCAARGLRATARSFFAAASSVDCV